MRIAISTGGGDAPGLNAVIRAAVLSAHQPRLGSARHQARLRRPAGRRRRHPADAGSRCAASRTWAARSSARRIAAIPFKFPDAAAGRHAHEVDRSDELIENARQLGIDAMISIGGDGSLAIAQRLYDKGMQDRRRAEDDRQRRQRDGHDVRLRHRGEHGARSDRQAAHDGGEPRSRDRDGGDGARRGIHRAARRARRHRRRHPDSRRFRTTSRRSARRSWRAIAPAGTSRSSSSRRARSRRAGTESIMGESLPGQAARRRHRGADRVRDPAAHRQGDALARARPPAARRHADRLRPAARDAIRRRRGAGGRARRSGGTWWRCSRRTS